MKKAKILTVLGVLLAMGITACNKTPASEEPKSEPDASVPAPSSEPSGDTSVVPPAPQKDATGHIWGADQDVAGDAEAGLVAYKKAACTEEDNAIKLTFNQSVFSYDQGSSRKSGTPEGYTKLDGNNQTWRFQFNFDKFAKGKLYLFGCMDGWSSNASKKAFSYNSKPNIDIKVNNEALDIAALSDVVYTDFLSGSGSDYSDDGYALIGNIVLNKGINEIAYTRLASMNTLVKDVVLVLDEQFDEEYGPVTDVAGETGYVGYKKSVSNLTGDVKLEINALEGTFAEGSSNKNGTAEGYLKLNSNGNKISWKFKYDKPAIGSLYQLGFMDSFSSNTLKTYSWVSSTSDRTTEEGNFNVAINEHIIDKSAFMNITFEDMTRDGEVLFDESKNYSPVALCPIGQLVLKNGDNVLSYERLGSYNLAISKLVLIVKNADAEFVVENDLTATDDVHYHAVTGTNVAFDKASHAWVSDSDLASTDTESTCSVKGIKHEKCSVCGKTRARELDLLAHTWVSDPDLASTDTESTCTTHGVAHMKCSVCGAKEAQELPFGAHTWVDGTAVTNSDSKSVIPMECSACHKVGAKMSENDYSSASFDAGKGDDTPDALRPSQGKGITYKIVVSKAGTYSLEFGMFCKSNGNVALSQRKFAVKVNGEDATVTLDGTKTPDGLGMTATNAVQVELCSEITLVQGENTIELTCASYRLHYKGNLVVAEK